MYNKNIRICAHCDQLYCIECSTHAGWEHFCSPSCENDWEKEHENMSDKEKKKSLEMDLLKND